MSDYIKEQVEEVKFGFWNKSKTQILFTIKFSQTKYDQGRPEHECYFGHVPLDSRRVGGYAWGESNPYWQKAQQAGKLIRKKIDNFIKTLAKNEDKGIKI